MFSRQLQHLLSPLRVRQGRFHRMLLVILWCWPTCQVEDHVNFRVSRVCAYVLFFELETLGFLQMVNVLEDPCREIVQTDDLRTNLAEYVADPAPKKPGPAGYQNILSAKRFRVNGFPDLS